MLCPDSDSRKGLFCVFPKAIDSVAGFGLAKAEPDSAKKPPLHKLFTNTFDPSSNCPDLNSRNYHVTWQVLNSANFGVPQFRKRVLLVGYLGEESGGEILSFTEANPKTIVKRFGGRQGDRVYAGNGLSCTLTSSAGGFAGNTGLYFMDMNTEPKITERARCITARQDSGRKEELKDELKAALSITLLDTGADMSITSLEQQIKEQENDLMRVVRITAERGNINMPSNSYTDAQGNKQYEDVFHPVTKEGRELLVKNVLDAYKQALEQAQTNSQTQSQTSGNQTMQQM